MLISIRNLKAIKIKNQFRANIKSSNLIEFRNFEVEKSYSENLIGHDSNCIQMYMHN